MQQQGNDICSVKTDESESPLSSEPISRTGSTNTKESSSTSSKESHLIISLQKQLESEKLSARNMKQQLELERMYATKISDKQTFLYNKVNPTTSIHTGTVGNSASILGTIPPNNLEGALSSTNFGSGSDSFGLRGLLANTSTHQQPTQNTDIYERLPGSDDTFKSLSNQSKQTMIYV